MIDTSWADGLSVKPQMTEEAEAKIQGSEAWKRWRNKGLGSSDAAVLVGWSPWKKIDELYLEKLGLHKPVFGEFQKRAMERGTQLEPVIRKWYENEYCPSEYGKAYVFKEDTEEDTELSFCRGSYDGVNREFKNEDGKIGKVIEIKAPNKVDHELAKNGMVPKKYIPQVNWLMMIAKVEHADYISYGSDDSYAVVHMKADPILIKELRERAYLLWRHVQTKTPITHWDEFYLNMARVINLEKIDVKEPTKVVLDEVKVEAEITDQEIESIVVDALLAKDAADIADAKYKALQEKLKLILGNNSSMTKAGASFGYTDVKGSVDYSVIPELIGLDLEQFRKASTKRFFFKKV